MKALGVGLGEVDFRDLEVERLESGAPVLAVHGRAADRAGELGVRRWLITLSHTDAPGPGGRSPGPSATSARGREP